MFRSNIFRPGPRSYFLRYEMLSVQTPDHRSHGPECNFRAGYAPRPYPRFARNPPGRGDRAEIVSIKTSLIRPPVLSFRDVIRTASHKSSLLGIWEYAFRCFVSFPPISITNVRAADRIRNDFPFSRGLFQK